MTRFVTIALFSLSFAGLGCPGSLDPSLTGTGGASGTGGSGGTPCDAPTVVFVNQCGTSVCHAPVNQGSNAGLDFSKATGVVAQLLGRQTQGLNGSACAGNTTPYLEDGSDPAAGLLIDKLFSNPPPCGVPMPYGGSLSNSDKTCVKSWALGVTTGVITQ